LCARHRALELWIAKGGNNLPVKADSGERDVMVEIYSPGGYMDTGFEVAPLSAHFVFGSLAPIILANLAVRYTDETGIKVKHWAIWVFANGSSVPVPTQIDTSIIPAIRAAQLLKMTLEEVSKVKMQSMREADRFMISTAIDQLDELCSIGIA